MRRALLLAILVSGVVACDKKEPPSPPPPRTARVPAPNLPELMLAIRQSEVVVAAEVVWVEPTTRKGSGPCSEQEVTYAIANVLAGATDSGRVSVAHPVCVDRPFVDHRTVALSPEHVFPSARFILFLRRGGAGHVFADDRFGILPDTPAIRADVEKAIANVAGSKGPGRQDPFNK
jgi:hypothetical protein